MAGSFVIQKNKKGEYYFNLKAGNNEDILTSEGYKAKAGAENGIQSVKTNAPNDARYSRKISKDKKHYFVLIAANNQPIGTSEMYNSKASMENGIATVKKTAPSAVVRDLT
jgi:uncharacterized protein YegP (UPF0339 family)